MLIVTRYYGNTRVDKILIKNMKISKRAGYQSPTRTMKEDIVYICPQTKTQCDDECCVSAEDCHAEAINSIISNCEPEQLNKHK